MPEQQDTRDTRRTCRFPGCTRPPVPGQPGSGRRPEYCSDPGHTRAAAWRERRRLAAEADASDRAGEEARPVDAARARAGQIAAQLTGMVEHLLDQLPKAVEELQVAGDLDVAAAQIEASRTEADERVAAAQSRALRAEQAAAAARADRVEADEAATEATEQAAQATLDAQAARAQAQQAARARDEAITSRDAARAARHAAEEAARAADDRVQREADRADRAEQALAEAARQRDLERDQAVELRGTLAQTAAQRDAAVNDAERERRYGEQRLTDLRQATTTQIDQLREELRAAQADAREQAARAERAEAAASRRPGRGVTRSGVTDRAE